MVLLSRIMECVASIRAPVELDCCFLGKGEIPLPISFS